MARRVDLDSNTFRLDAPSGACSFTYRRLRPGLMLLTIAGQDRNELGPLAYEPLDAEVARHGALDLSIDLRGADTVGGGVREGWTDWFQSRRASLKRVTILTGSRPIEMAVAVSKLFSRTGDLIQILTSPTLFSQALTLAAGRPVEVPEQAPLPLPTASASLIPSSIQRRELPGGVVRLESLRGAFTFARPRPATLWVGIEGEDTGDFATAALDEPTRALGREPLALFVDAREAVGVSAAVGEEWTGWIATHRQRLEGVHMLVRSKYLRLTVEVARHLSRTGEVLRLYDSAEDFEQVLARRLPGFAPPGRG